MKPIKEEAFVIGSLTYEYKLYDTAFGLTHYWNQTTVMYEGVEHGKANSGDNYLSLEILQQRMENKYD